jgi:hypothetical protein
MYKFRLIETAYIAQCSYSNTVLVYIFFFIYIYLSSVIDFNALHGQLFSILSHPTYRTLVCVNIRLVEEPLV